MSHDHKLMFIKMSTSTHWCREMVGFGSYETDTGQNSGSSAHKTIKTNPAFTF